MDGVSNGVERINRRVWLIYIIACALKQFINNRVKVCWNYNSLRMRIVKREVFYETIMKFIKWNRAHN